LRKGVQDKALDAVAFSQAQGVWSAPVRTSFGYHILRVKEIKAPGAKDFAMARPDAEKSWRQEQGEKAYFDKADRLGNLVYEHPDTLAVAAKELALPVQEAGPFAKGEVTAGLPTEVTQKAFQAELSVGGVNSDPLELPDNRTVVLRVLERLPERIPELKEVKDKARAAFVEETAREQAKALGVALLERLKKGEARAAVITEQRLEWKEAQGVDRASKDANLAVVRAAFRTGHPAGDKPLYGGLTMGTGDYALLEVTKVVDGDPVADLKAEDRRRLADQIAQMRGQMDWANATLERRAAAKIVVHKDKL
jgi:peptidyl-prolyl cis-trans isomerase D